MFEAFKEWRLARRREKGLANYGRQDDMEQVDVSVDGVMTLRVYRADKGKWEVIDGEFPITIEEG